MELDTLAEHFRLEAMSQDLQHFLAVYTLQRKMP